MPTVRSACMWHLGYRVYMAFGHRAYFAIGHHVYFAFGRHVCIVHVWGQTVVA